MVYVIGMGERDGYIVLRRLKIGAYYTQIDTGY